MEALRPDGILYKRHILFGQCRWLKLITWHILGLTLTRRMLPSTVHPGMISESWWSNGCLIDAHLSYLGTVLELLIEKLEL